MTDRTEAEEAHAKWEQEMYARVAASDPPPWYLRPRHDDKPDGTECDCGCYRVTGEDRGVFCDMEGPNRANAERIVRAVNDAAATIAFVDKERGNDATAVVGDPDKPFLSHALAASQAAYVFDVESVNELERLRVENTQLREAFVKARLAGLSDGFNIAEHWATVSDDDGFVKTNPHCDFNAARKHLYAAIRAAQMLVPAEPDTKR